MGKGRPGKCSRCHLGLADLVKKSFKDEAVRLERRVGESPEVGSVGWVPAALPGLNSSSTNLALFLLENQPQHAPAASSLLPSPPPLLPLNSPHPHPDVPFAICLSPSPPEEAAPVDWPNGNEPEQ